MYELSPGTLWMFFPDGFCLPGLAPAIPRAEILGGVNFLDDLAQRIEHGSGSNSVVSRALKGAGQAL